MNIYILACGVFEIELNKILDELKAEKSLPEDITVKYLPFGLHTDLDRLKRSITTNLDNIKSDKIILLYGSKCHYMFHEFLKDYDNLITFTDADCIDLIMEDERRDTEKNLYLTPGWALKFDELNQSMSTVDIYDVRHQYGRYENIIIGDTGICELSEDMIFDLYEKTQVPIDIQPVDITSFKDKIVNAINKAIESDL